MEVGTAVATTTKSWSVNKLTRRLTKYKNQVAGCLDNTHISSVVAKSPVQKSLSPMTEKIPENIQGQNRQAGFSLLELMIVVDIMCILAGYVGYNLSSGATELKTFVFNTKSHFHKAKFEAVKRNRNVYIDFDFNAPFGTAENGYTVWADEDSDTIYTAGTDTIIETIVFNSGPAIYATPRPEEPGASNNGPGPTKTIDDGVSAASDRIIMRPNGRSENSSVYLYLPRSATDSTLSAGPWVIITSTVGRIRVDEWGVSGWVVDQ